MHLLIECEDNQIAGKLVINFISTYLKKQVEPGIGVNRHCKKTLYKKLTQVFFCDTISDKFKHLLEISFTRFISTLTAEFIAIRADLCESIISYFNSEVSSDNLKNCFYLIRAVLSDNL